MGKRSSFEESESHRRHDLNEDGYFVDVLPKRRRATRKGRDPRTGFKIRKRRVRKLIRKGRDPRTGFKIRRRRRRKNPHSMSRRQRTGILIASVGIATGLLAVILWPKVKALLITPTVTAGTPTVTQRAAEIAALLEG